MCGIDIESLLEIDFGILKIAVFEGENAEIIECAARLFLGLHRRTQPPSQQSRNEITQQFGHGVPPVHGMVRLTPPNVKELPPDDMAPVGAAKGCVTAEHR